MNSPFKKAVFPSLLVVSWTITYIKAMCSRNPTGARLEQLGRKSVTEQAARHRLQQFGKGPSTVAAVKTAPVS